jgi:hypothetical protein
VSAAAGQAPSLRQELHQLCQPLTRLQWRLELSRCGSERELEQAIEDALADVQELTECVRRLRTRMEETDREEVGTQEIRTQEIGTQEIRIQEFKGRAA